MRVERGTPTVAIGIYLRILFALGLDESILFVARDDEMGRTLQDIDLKNRQRASKNQAKRIIDEVRAAMEKVRQVARQCGISDHEAGRFATFA